jgi:holo-[acyl-carrier protein] synthase
MIYGIGTDIIQISRLQAALTRSGERFAAKILGPDEFLVFQQRRAGNEARGLRYLATRFAAKEAFSKAIGLGLRVPMPWRTAQIMNAESGQPILRASGALQEFMQQHRLAAQISISDEAEYAVGFAIVEQN